jgi:hypothetical protein
MALTEHQKALSNQRQKRFYQRNKLRILEKNKQDRLTIKRLRDETSNLTLQDIADNVADPVHAAPHLVYNLPTLITLFEKEKDDVRKPLAIKTIQKHISEIKNIYRILDIPKDESLIKFLTADPALSIDAILQSKQIKDPTKNYATSVATGRFTSILYSFDLAFRTTIDHRTIEIMKLAKKEFVLARIKTMDKYNRELETKKETMVIISYSALLRRVKDKFGEDSKEWLVMYCLYGTTHARDNFFLYIISFLPADEDKKKNYLIVPANKDKNVVIRLNHYKTMNKFGTVNATMTTDRSLLVRNYLEKNKISVGELLFPEHAGSEGLSGFVGALMRKCDVKGGINLLRKIILSSEDDIENQPIENRMKMAEKFGHSIQTQRVYTRKLAPDTEKVVEIPIVPVITVPIGVNKKKKKKKKTWY